MGTRQYVGARYVPTFANPIQWDNQRIYEPLTMVTYLNNTYTSKKPVPRGVDINNTEYWALSGNYNAQVEQYRQEVEELINAVVVSAIDVTKNGVKNDGTDTTDNLVNLIQDHPENCTFYFPAGTYTINGNTTITRNITCLIDGLISGNGTLISYGEIIAPLNKIFDGNITVEYHGCSSGHPEWFGASPDNVDNSNEISACCKVFPVTVLSNVFYPITNTIIISTSNREIRGAGSFSANLTAQIHNTSGTASIRIIGCEDVRIEHVSVNYTVAGTLGARGFDLVGAIRAKLYDCSTYNATEGFAFANTVDCRIDECFAYFDAVMPNTAQTIGFHLGAGAAPSSAVGSNASLQLTGCNAFGTPDYTLKFGYLFSVAPSDVWLDFCECSRVQYGVFSNEPIVSSTRYRNIRINNFICDIYTIAGISLAGWNVANLEINGGYFAPQDNLTTYNDCIILTNINGAVNIVNNQLICSYVRNRNDKYRGIILIDCTGVTSRDNQIMEFYQPIATVGSCSNLIFEDRIISNSNEPTGFTNAGVLKNVKLALNITGKFTAVGVALGLSESASNVEINNTLMGDNTISYGNAIISKTGYQNDRPTIVISGIGNNA